MMIAVEGVNLRVSGRLVRTARLDGERYSFLDDPEPIIAGLRRARSVDLFTFTQRLPDVTPKHSFHMEWDNFAALPVSTFDAWWTGVLDNKTRNMIRRAEKKGIETREVPFGEGLVRDIWTIYNECPVRQGKPYGHYGKSLETVHREEATFLDRSVFIGAFCEGAMIGFIKLTHDETATQAGLMNIVSMIQHRDKAPTNALISAAVRSCAERHIPYLVYASFAYGNKKPDSLADFKRNNGFQRFDIPRYYVPISMMGRAALKLGVQRKWSDRLPEALLDRARLVRSAWYQRRFAAQSKGTAS